MIFNRKKAQIESQIFIYIMVIIIASGVLIYGYKAVKGFIGEGDKIIIQQFETKIKGDLKSLSYQSSREEKYDLPSSILQVCFKGYSAESNPNSAGCYVVAEQDRTDSGYNYPIIQVAMGSGIDDNVFLYPKGDKSFYAGTKIDLGDANGACQPTNKINFKCFDVKGGLLKIRLTGQGETVLITQ